MADGRVADMEVTWGTHDEALAALQISEAALQEAQAAFDAATDELDRAEIKGVLDIATASHTDAQDASDQARGRVARHLGEARQISNRERMPEARANAVRGDETFQVAVDRAWAALLSADPGLAALSAAVPVGPDYRVPTPRPPRQVTPDEVLADLQRPFQRVFNRNAQQAAREVYSQADSTLIAEVLATTAVEIAQVVNDAAIESLGSNERELAPFDLSDASDVLHLAGGSVLEPFDAAAYQAARAADPNAPVTLIDSPEAYARSTSVHITTGEGIGYYWETAAEGPTYYRYLGGEWPASDDIALATYIEREQAVYDALPAALELAREATAALQAAEQAERTRQRDAEHKPYRTH